MNLLSTDPSVVRSIKQRELLNVWLRLVGKDSQPPRFESFNPERFADERPDIVLYDISYEESTPRFKLTFHGARLVEAFGFSGTGLELEDVLGPRFVHTSMPMYYACVEHRRPVYSIYVLADKNGSDVAYERLLLPFYSSDHVDVMLASCKTISDEGKFEQRGLMHFDSEGPRYTVAAVIDRSLARSNSRPAADDEVTVSDSNL
jgi:hypothetical protein